MEITTEWCIRLGNILITRNHMLCADEDLNVCWSDSSVCWPYLSVFEACLMFYNQSDNHWYIMTALTNIPLNSIYYIFFLSIQVWCLKNRKLLSILRGHSDEIECLACYKDILVSGGWDNLITIWDLKHGSKLTDLIGHQEVINCVKIKDFSCLISASGDSTIKVWNYSISTGPNSQDRLMFNQVNFIDLKGHSSDVYSLDFYGDFIASTGADSLVIIWNFSGDLLYKLNGHLGIVRFCYMDDYKLITGGDAKRIVIWDYKSGKLLNTLHRNPNKINFMSLDDTKIITASPDIESNITLICYCQI
ncbi:F-box WD repeat-containing 7-like [Brachionus plicatilis]|uniref:F-box WD repeat-containing 7-like n=1 Tax=Brachionus plicatilis TaxID=10195 RepID=A0A3M7PER4_BRAPC|nr:F-box WD repeat-containing 7-like [Brachionus plicatilis]